MQRVHTVNPPRDGEIPARSGRISHQNHMAESNQKGFFTSRPGLTATAVKRHLPESEETQKGHMRKMKSGICSTKHGQANTTTPPATKQPTRQIKKRKDIMVRLVDVQDEMKQTIYTDQTSKFPTKSGKGNQYIIVINQA